MKGKPKSTTGKKERIFAQLLAAWNLLMSLFVQLLFATYPVCREAGVTGDRAELDLTAKVK